MLSYRYDDAGDRTRMTSPDTGADALYVAYVHDALNLATMVEENGATSGPGLLASHGYDSLGRRSSTALADAAEAVNGAVEYIGRRRLRTLLEKVVEELSFAADRSGDAVVIDAADVKRLVGDLARDADL